MLVRRNLLLLALILIPLASFAQTTPAAVDTYLMPVSPSRTDSRMPGELEATTGVPHAAASRFVMPQPSFGEANASAHERRSSASFSSSIEKQGAR